LLTPIRSKKFKQDVELAEKRGWPTDQLETVLDILIDEKPVPAMYKDHP
jgi:mRNA interferase YafQ